jgi:hypothetical protein
MSLFEIDQEFNNRNKGNKYMDGYLKHLDGPFGSILTIHGCCPLLYKVKKIRNIFATLFL